MSLSPVCSRIPQPRDVTQNLPPQVIFDLHGREGRIDLEDLTVG
jgi:hypothetical protein